MQCIALAFGFLPEHSPRPNCGGLSDVRKVYVSFEEEGAKFVLLETRKFVTAIPAKKSRNNVMPRV